MTRDDHQALQESYTSIYTSVQTESMMEMLPDTADMLEVLKNAFPVLAGVGIAAIGAKLEELKKEKELRGVAGPSHRVEPRTGGSFEA